MSIFPIVILLFFVPTFPSSHFQPTRECVMTLDQQRESYTLTHLGKLEGVLYKFGNLTHPRDAKVFPGFPYTFSIIGEFRFAKHLRLPPFGVISSKNFGKSCLPNRFYNGATNLADDCLNLNFFIPTGGLENQTWPTLFLIHGGAFGYGSSADLKWEPIVSNFVSRGIAVITANYRLGINGFFSAGEGLSTNNAAIDDLREAFSFGIQASAGMGLDAKRYVLGGIEGGAVLAEYLIHFPEIAQNISGLFLFGGSALSPWASTPDIFNNSLDFAHDLGINFKNSSQLIASMQSIQPKKIFEVQERRRMSKDSKHFVEFTPTFDKANFGKNDFLESIKSLPSIPVFMITSSNEGAIRSVPIQHGYYKVFNEFTGIPVDQQANFTCTDFHAFTAKIFPNVDIQKVIEFYACTGNEQKSPFEIYNEFLGDFNFYVPQAFTALIYAAYDARVYVTVVKTDDDLMEMEAGFSELPHSLIADDYLFSSVKPNTRTMAAESMEKYQFIKDQLITDIIQFVKKSELNFPPVPPTSYAISKLPHKLVTSNSAEFVENDTFFAPKLIFWTKFLSTVGFKELSTIFQNKTSLFE